MPRKTKKRTQSLLEKAFDWFLSRKKLPKPEKIENTLSILEEKGSVVCGTETEHEVLKRKNKKPFCLTGYIDASTLYKEDTIEILIYVTINGVEGLYAVHEQKGTERERVISFSRLVIPEQVRVCIKQTIGVGRLINYLFIIG